MILPKYRAGLYDFTILPSNPIPCLSFEVLKKGSSSVSISVFSLCVTKDVKTRPLSYFATNMGSTALRPTAGQV